MTRSAAAVSAPHPLALELLEEFARRTGVTDSGAPQQRYLWTDAFAVTGYLGLHQRTGESSFLDRARALIDRVHHVLGRHRTDDDRDGWISSLSEQEGAAHPTIGGLRIGKRLPERAADAAYDPHLEWDRDGQYYHYLTRWMHALNRMWRVSGEVRCHGWAVELASAANRAFIARDRIYWKMSIDLRRPLVPSMGHHDPLDGLITTETLRAAAPPDADDVLGDDVARLAELCRDRDWATQDALGTGGLLADCFRLVELERAGRRLDVRDRVFRDAARSLDYAALALDPIADARERLAFRELGLAIGIQAAQSIGLARAHARLAGQITDFWSEPRHRMVEAWLEHQDINDVMLAVALEPDGYLAL